MAAKAGSERQRWLLQPDFRSHSGGEKTLVVSTDPAHSLSDSFETELENEPVEVDENLFGTEIDPETRADRYHEDRFGARTRSPAVGIRLGEEEVEPLFGSGIPAGVTKPPPWTCSQSTSRVKNGIGSSSIPHRRATPSDCSNYRRS